MATKEHAPLSGDIRRSRPYLLTAAPLRHLAFRLGSVVCLLTLDLVAVAFGLYGALTIRELYYGHSPILWGVLWDAEGNWFPFVALVAVLVFWQAGLYAERERRAGFGRVVSSLVIVALLVLSFGLGTGHDFTTFGLIPTAFAITAVLDGVLRASYETVSRELLHALGVRRRAIVVGEGEHLEHLLRTLGAVRGGIDYEFLGVVSAAEDGSVGLPRLGQVEGLPAVLAGHPADELIVTDSDYSERELLQIVENAHRSGVKVRIAPKTTELLVQRGRVRARPGAAPLRAETAGVRRNGLGREAHVRPGRQRACSGGRAAGLARDRGRDQARLEGPRLLPRPAQSASARKPSRCSSSARCTWTRPTGRSRSSAATRPTARCSRSATTRG